MPKESVIYARVSSKEQDREGFSIPAQLDICKRYAGDNGLEVVKEFVDIESAKATGRERFGEMMDYIKKHPTCIIIVEKTDRLSRNFGDVVMLDDLVSNGLQIHRVREGIYSKESRATDKFFYGMMVLQARFYIDDLSEKVRKGNTRKAEEGLYPSHAPVGYRNVKVNGKNGMEPDPATAPIIRRMFDLYATGHYTLMDLMKIARSEGLCSQFGKPINHSSVHRLMRNIVYTDRFEWAGKIYKHRPFETIVSFDTWRTVQKLMSRYEGKGYSPDGGGAATKYKKQGHLLSGIVTCGHCGRALVGEAQKGQLKKGAYVYYRCGKRCEPYVREEVLFEKFRESVKRVEFGRDVLSLLVKSLKTSHSNEQAYRDECIRNLSTNYQNLQVRINRLYDDFLDGRITKEMHDQRAKQLREDQDCLTEEIHAHEHAERNFIDDGILLLELAQKAHSYYVEETPAEKSRLLKILHSNSSWKDGALTTTYRSPFDLIADANRECEERGEVAVGENGLSPTWLGD